jgi:hypothetical protein
MTDRDLRAHFILERICDQMMALIDDESIPIEKIEAKYNRLKARGEKIAASMKHKEGLMDGL